MIHLASLVPANKLAPVSTACSACVSHLKQMSEVTPLTEIQVVIHALCAWNRFADIQDVVVDWIDQAFRCEGLNQSQAVVSCSFIFSFKQFSIYKPLKTDEICESPTQLLQWPCSTSTNLSPTLFPPTDILVQPRCP